MKNSIAITTVKITGILIISSLLLQLTRLLCPHIHIYGYRTISALLPAAITAFLILSILLAKGRICLEGQTEPEAEGAGLKSRTFSNPDRLLVLYILAAGIFCHILPIPELVKGILAMPAFIILPYLAGNMISRIKIFRDIADGMDAISHYIISWSLGVTLIVLSMGTLYALYLFDFRIYLYSFIAILTIYYLLFPKSKNLAAVEIEKIPMVIILLFLIILTGFVLYYTPFPLWPDYDFHELHNPLSWLITDYNTILISRSYLCVLSMLAAISSSLFNADTYTFGWTCAHLLFPAIFAFGLYIFLRAFTDRRWIFITLFLILIGLWTQQFQPTLGIYDYAPRVVIYLSIPLIFFFLENNVRPLLEDKEMTPSLFYPVLLATTVSSALLFFLSLHTFCSFGPNGFIYILLYFVLLGGISTFLPKIGRRLFFYLAPTALFTLVLLHNSMGLMACAAITLYLLFTYISTRHPEKIKLLVVSFIVVFGVLFFSKNLKYFDIQSIFLNPAAGKTIGINFRQKLWYLSRLYPPGILYFLIAGLAVVMLNPKSKGRFLTAVFFFYLLSFLLVDNKWIPRLLRIVHVLSLPMILCGIAAVMDILSKFISGANATKRLFYPLLILLLLLIPFNAIVTADTLMISQWIKYVGHFSMASRQEYSAAAWMRKNLKKDIIIISDPITTMNLSSISHIRGMAHIWHVKQQDMLLNVLNHPDSECVYNRIQRFINEDRMVKFYGAYPDEGLSKEWIKRQSAATSAIVVVIGRTCDWLRNKKTGKYYAPIRWFPMTIEDMGYMNKFFDKRYFTLLYNEGDEIYVFGVNPHPDTLFRH